MILHLSSSGADVWSIMAAIIIGKLLWHVLEAGVAFIRAGWRELLEERTRSRKDVA